MNKKAFTFVELAIALVIIGIILTMAMKGKELIYVAQLKKEVRTLQKMETALYVYIAANLKEPALQTNTGSYEIDISQFDTILPASDRKMLFTTGSWQYARAKLIQDPVGKISDWATTVGHVFPYGDSPILTAQAAYPYLRADAACYIEKTLDEGKLDFGNGRSQGGGGVNSDIDVNDCDANKTKKIIYHWKLN